MPRAIFDDVARARRILFYGVTGSGKSTAATRFGRARGLPVVLVDDAVGWLPADVAPWTNRDDEAMRAIAADLAAEEEWVFDSAYSQFRDVVYGRAQLMIALDYPRWLSLGRLVRRTWRRVVDGDEVCNGNRENWKQVFSRDSILRWHFHSFASKRDRIRELEASLTGVPVLRLTHPRQLEELIALVRR
ncbi:P-loop NTPase family protein [Trueperella pyogenes]